MPSPQDHIDREREEAERLWQQKVAEAHALLERHPEYPSVRIQIHDKDREITESITPEIVEDKKRLTEERLEFLLKFLNIRGEAYLRLATDLESVKAITTIMKEFARGAWWQLSGGSIAIEAVPPTSQFTKPHETQKRRDKILRVAHDWSMEAYRRLASLGKSEQPEATKARVSTSTAIESFPKRAQWIRDRLRERGWDHNRPVEFGGPDRKTMKRMLAGLQVHDGTLDKLITALNKLPRGKNLGPSDIPTD